MNEDKKKEWLELLPIDGTVFPVHGKNWIARIEDIDEEVFSDIGTYRINFVSEKDPTENRILSLQVSAGALDSQKRSSSNNRPRDVISGLIGWLHSDEQTGTMNYEALEGATESKNLK